MRYHGIVILAAGLLAGCALSPEIPDEEEEVEAPGSHVQEYGDHDLECFSSYKQCVAVCEGVCERRINCGGASAHKCFEP
jgi:hypothetical protein